MRDYSTARSLLNYAQKIAEGSDDDAEFMRVNELAVIVATVEIAEATVEIAKDLARIATALETGSRILTRWVTS